ncbi:MAG: hypothetical protein RLZZ552_1486 [Verrucomicrobiota bacterium]
MRAWAQGAPLATDGKATTPQPTRSQGRRAATAAKHENSEQETARPPPKGRWSRIDAELPALGRRLRFFATNNVNTRRRGAGGQTGTQQGRQTFRTYVRNVRNGGQHTIGAIARHGTGLARVVAVGGDIIAGAGIGGERGGTRPEKQGDANEQDVTGQGQGRQRFQKRERSQVRRAFAMGWSCHPGQRGNQRAASPPAPRASSCAPTNGRTSAGLIPTKVSVSARASVTAGFTKKVDEVAQYPAVTVSAT